MTATTAPSARKRRPWVPVVIVLAVIAALVAVFFIADAIVRGVAEQRVKAEIEQHLPSNVQADVQVSIGGVSVIGQYLAGTFDEVRLSDAKLTVDGIPLDVDVTATGVPVEQDQPIGNVTSTITVDAQGAQQITKAAGLTGKLTLGRDVVGYADELKALGLTVPYSFEVKPTTSADRVTFVPTKVDVDAGAFGTIDLSRAAEALLATNPPSLCVAQYLPAGATLDGLTITPKQATAHLSSTTLRLDAASLQTLGTCS